MQGSRWCKGLAGWRVEPVPAPFGEDGPPASARNQLRFASGAPVARTDVRAYKAEKDLGARGGSG